MSEQLSFVDLLDPPAPAVTRRADLPRAAATIRAYGGTRELSWLQCERAPFEMEIRGIACTITYCVGFATTVIAGPGAPFWSETGFRSFGFHTEDPERIAAMVEQYIDAPPKSDGTGGLGGRLVHWWPPYATQWRDGTGFILEHGRDRSALWAQWGPERHAAIWAKREGAFEDALRQMEIDGIDPNDLGRPRGFKGQWPRWTYESRLAEFSS